MRVDPSLEVGWAASDKNLLCGSLREISVALMGSSSDRFPDEIPQTGDKTGANNGGCADNNPREVGVVLMSMVREVVQDLKG